MNEDARGRVRVEQGQKRVRAYLAGHLVADTTRPLLVWEVPYYPTYYVPATDVVAELAETGDTRHSPGRGEARLYDVYVKDAVAEKAASLYTEPEVDELRDVVRLDWEAVDQWFEEDEPIFVHPRSPYTRIDVLNSSRHVEVRIGGETVADSRQPRVLYETGLRPRYYLPRTDVRMDLLRSSETRTHCPYKGTASYWSVEVGGTVHDDVVWTYPAPLPESQKVTGLACFYDERVELYVDGVRQE
ncbi:MAG: DUF427 domain-containing protein [Streptosporangiales bacterium]|nr:DUF427 domain-containing protein [Streptosporangiales bacterium]MBO0890794.1 DUF427 domain-containing protein [Acidothermales bacterium]